MLGTDDNSSLKVLFGGPLLVVLNQLVSSKISTVLILLETNLEQHVLLHCQNDDRICSEAKIIQT